MAQHALRSEGTYADTIAEYFIHSLENSVYRNKPYDHWLMENVLPVATVHAINALPFATPENMIWNGKRESNNSQRTYFTRENQQRFPVCREFVEAFDSYDVLHAISQMTGTDLTDSLLRVEYCQDTGDFWLEPHTDISVKRFTMLMYLSDDPALHNCGTDIYDASPDHKLVYSAPYAINTGLIFIPGQNTWHGFARRTITGVRKSLIVNYVSPEWRDTWELAY